MKFWRFFAIFEFGISVHEKMRHFIIVIEKYTKNDDNQNINGLNKVHENNFLMEDWMLYIQIDLLLPWQQ